jgi:non-heme chloroperoxidase
MLHRRTLLFSGLTSAVALYAQPRVVASATQKSSRRGIEIVTADRTRLYHRDWGSGPVIVLLAPWTLSSQWWDYHLTTLTAAGFRCIAYDRRGHARSDEPDSGYDFDTLADDLSAVLTRLDLHDVTLVGHSFGAAEVVRYLARHRAARVARAVLVATVTPFIMRSADNPTGAPVEALEKARLGLLQDKHGRIAAAAEAFFGVPTNPVPKATLDWWTRSIIDGCSLRVALELNRAMTSTDFRPDLRTIRVPTLLVHGDADTSTRLEATSRPTQALIAGSTLKVYEGAAHGLPVTHAARLHDDLVAFAAAGPSASSRDLV